MTISKILVIGADSGYQTALEDRLPRHFPNVTLEFVPNWETAATMASRKNYDLYLGASQPGEPNSFQGCIFTLRTIHYETHGNGARVAVFSAGRGQGDPIKRRAIELGVGFYSKLDLDGEVVRLAQDLT